MINLAYVINIFFCVFVASEVVFELFLIGNDEVIKQKNILKIKYLKEPKVYMCIIREYVLQYFTEFQQ